MKTSDFIPIILIGLSSLGVIWSILMFVKFRRKNLFDTLQHMNVEHLKSETLNIKYYSEGLQRVGYEKKLLKAKIGLEHIKSLEELVEINNEIAKLEDSITRKKEHIATIEALSQKELLNKIFTVVKIDKALLIQNIHWNAVYPDSINLPPIKSSSTLNDYYKEYFTALMRDDSLSSSENK